MHYNNGRIAQVHDWVVGVSHNSDGKPVVGVVMELMEQRGNCNMRFHRWKDEYIHEDGADDHIIPATDTKGFDDYGDVKEFILCADGLIMLRAIANAQRTSVAL